MTLGNETEREREIRGRKMKKTRERLREGERRKDEWERARYIKKARKREKEHNNERKREREQEWKRERVLDCMSLKTDEWINIKKLKSFVNKFFLFLFLVSANQLFPAEAIEANWSKKLSTIFFAALKLLRSKLRMTWKWPSTDHNYIQAENQLTKLNISALKFWGHNKETI